MKIFSPLFQTPPVDILFIKMPNSAGLHATGIIMSRWTAEENISISRMGKLSGLPGGNPARLNSTVMNAAMG